MFIVILLAILAYITTYGFFMGIYKFDGTYKNYELRHVFEDNIYAYLILFGISVVFSGLLLLISLGCWYYYLNQTERTSYHIDLPNWLKD